MKLTIGSPILKGVLFLMLASATAFSALAFDRYLPFGPELLQNAGLQDNAAGWDLLAPEGTTATVADGMVHLVSTNPRASVQLKQTIQRPETDHVRFSAQVRCKGVVPGEKSWNRGRLILAQDDGHAKRWDVPHNLVSLTGTETWKPHEQVFALLPETRHLVPTVQLSRCTGTLWARGMSLRSVRQADWYGWAQGGAYAAWGFFFVFLASTWQKEPGRFFKVVLCISFLLILAGTLIPGTFKKELTNRIQSTLQNPEPGAQTTTHPASKSADSENTGDPVPLMKAGHFALFALFAFVLTGALLRAPLTHVFQDLFTLAGATELAQFYVDGRTPLLTDFALDLTGGILGMALATLTWRSFSLKYDR